MNNIFNIDDVVTLKNDVTLKKYKITKINHKTFGCVDEENNKSLIKKNNIIIYDENYYLIDRDVEYWIIIKFSENGKEHTYKYDTLNKIFEKMSEYYIENELDNSLKKQICNNLLENFNYSYTINNISTYSIIYIDIYKVDISKNYKNCEIICTCPTGFKGCGAFCKKHR